MHAVRVWHKTHSRGGIRMLEFATHTECTIVCTCWLIDQLQLAFGTSSASVCSEQKKEDRTAISEDGNQKRPHTQLTKRTLFE